MDFKKVNLLLQMEILMYMFIIKIHTKVVMAHSKRDLINKL